MGDARDDEFFVNFDALREDESKLPAVLVLGGSTFMGRATVEALVARPARVCLVNRGRRYWGTKDTSGGRAAKLIADRRDGAEFARRLREATRRLGRSWDLVADFSAYNTADMQAALEGLQGEFEVYAYISSDSIYEVSALAAANWRGGGPAIGEDFGVRPAEMAERQRLNEADSYGHGKWEGEEALASWFAERGEAAGSSRSVSLRLPDVVGPFDDTLRLWAYWHWLRAGEDGAPPPQVKQWRAAKRPRTGEEASSQEIPPDPPLALVYSKDVARFIVGLLDMPPPEQAPRCDAVNLACDRQVGLADLLTIFAKASGLARDPPRLVAVKRPKSYLPSVDRPWPLDCRRAAEVYGFVPTPLEEVLRSCADFFAEGCRAFPGEAQRAAAKLPREAGDMALKRAGLKRATSSSSDSS